jgi:ligand-binding SRPBCC domain-containing protein
MYYQFKREQFVHTDIKTLWNFASSPSNLKEITPEQMGFKITTPHITEKMYPGMIITYKVSPLLNIPMNWMTEITHVEPMSFFIDEQRMGPYKLWHHQHLFEEKQGGVLMTDIVTYIPPFGILGDIANWLIIKKKLRDIFAYRFDAVDRIFPCKNDI